MNTYVCAYLKSKTPDLLGMGEKVTMRAIRALFCANSAGFFVIIAARRRNKHYEGEPGKQSFPMAILETRRRDKI